MCQSAVDGLVSEESARAYLIAAAERAGILERGWKTTMRGVHSGYRVVEQSAPLSAEQRAS